MSTLYELSAQYQAALEAVEYNEVGEISIESIAALEAIEGSLDEKLINYACMSKNTSVDADKIKEAIEGMRKKEKRLRAKSEFFTGRIKMEMEQLGKQKIDSSPYFDISIKKNPPKLEIYDRTAIPESYDVTETITSIDEAAIKQALKNGVEIPGAKLKQETRLEIK